MATRRGPDGTVRVSVQGTMNTVNWANIFWANLTTSATPSQADLDAWLTAFQAAYKTNFQAYATTAVAYTQAQASYFYPTNLILPSIVAMSGTGAGTAGAGQVQSACAVVSWQTGVYWRGGKPRTYLPDVDDGNYTAQRTLTSTAQTNLKASALAFRTAVNALTSGAITATQLGFVSFRSGNADRTPPLFFGFSDVKIHPRLGTQRRRLGKWVP